MNTLREEHIYELTNECQNIKLYLGQKLSLQIFYTSQSCDWSTWKIWLKPHLVFRISYLFQAILVYSFLPFPFPFFFFFFFNGHTRSIWKFPGQGFRDWIWAIAGNAWSFNPMCQLGDWTCTSTDTWAAAAGFLTHHAIAETPTLVLILKYGSEDSWKENKMRDLLWSKI